MKPKSILGLLIITPLLIPTSSYAYQWGELSLNPIASVREEYDSNITYAESNELSDFITHLRLGVEANQEGKNQTAKLSASLRQDIFAKNTGFNNFSQDLDGMFRRDITEYDHIRFVNNFVHAEDPRSFEDQFGRTSGRYDYLQNYFLGSFGHDFTSQFSLKFKYQNNYYNPSRENLQTSIQHKPGLEADYKFDSQTEGNIFYDYTHRTFDGDNALNKHSTGVGARHYLTTQLYADGHVGADFITPAGSQTLVRPQFFIGLSNQANEETLYGISFTKEYADTSYSQFLFNSWKLTANWQRNLTERLKGYFNAFTGSGKYEGLGISEKLNGFGLGLGYQLTPDSDIGLGYSFIDNNSNTNTRDYTKTTVSLQFNVKF